MKAKGMKEENNYNHLRRQYHNIIDDFDDTLRESTSELSSESMEFYALDIKSISELESKVSNKRSLKVLKLMHWNSLVSTQGIEEYVNLEHLDLSLNQLESFEWDSLPDLMFLNLSWNSIIQAPNLKNFSELKIQCSSKLSVFCTKNIPRIILLNIG